MIRALCRQGLARVNGLAVNIELWRFCLLSVLFLATSVAGMWLVTPSLPLFYADLVLLAPFLMRRAARLLVSISLVIAALRVIQSIFGIDQLFVSSYLLLRNLTWFPVGFVALVLGLAVASLWLLYWSMSRLPSRTVRLSMPVIALAAGAVLGLKHFEDKVKLNLVGTSYGYLLGSFKFASMFNGHYSLPPPQGEHSPGGRGAELALARGTNYLLIVVDSLGMPRNVGLRQTLLSAIGDPRLRDRYEVTFGETAANGSTIHVEIRELCGGFLAGGLFDDGNGHCLPSELGRHGYRTLAIHANHARVYGRDTWYSKIGFERYVSADTGEMPSTESFGRWGTLLDRDSIEWAANQLTVADGTRKFVYLLTVSTHLPATMLPDALPDPRCLAVAPEHACVHLANLRSVIAAATESAKKLHDITIVLVGDHPPPFVSPRSRSTFSRDTVPYVILAPRRQGDAATDLESTS